MGLIWLVLANAGVLLASRRLLTLYGTGRPFTDAVIFLLSRLLLISLAVAITGALHLLRPWALGSLGAVAAGILCARGVHREFLPLWKFRPDPALFLLGALAVRLLFHVWLLSPFLADVTSYHLPKVAEWVTHGTLFTDFGPDRRAWFPAGFELVETWWVVFLHHDVLIEMAGLEFLALGAAAAGSLACRLGLPERAGLFAAALYGTVPGLMVQSVFAINDPASASLVVATFALVLDAVPAAWVATAVALGSGLKPTYLFALPGCAALWLWMRRTAPAARPRSAPALWALAAMALLLGSSWYVRNTVRFANPIYPAGTDALDFGQVKVLRTVGPRWKNLSQNLSDLDQRMLDRRKGIGGMMSHVAGWGVIAVAFGLTGLLAACRESREWRIVTAAYVVSLVSALALIENDEWCLRYILFSPGLPIVAATRLATQIPLLRLPIVLLSALTIVGTVCTEDVPLQSLQEAARSDWQHRTFAKQLIPDVDDSRVACYGDVSSMSYLLYRPDYSREVTYLRPSSPEDLLRLMEERHLRTLYALSCYDRNGWRELLDKCVRSGRLKHVDGPWYVLLPP